MRYLALTYLVILFTLSCNTREHNNIFDPQNPTDSLELGLRITASDDQIITMEWSPPGQVDYSGFNIYRKADTETNFQKIGQVCDTCHQFTDRGFQVDHEYHYYVTVQGQDIESIPSKSIATVPGPGTFWLIDREDYVVYHLTYDLRHVLHKRYTIGLSNALSFNADYTRGLLIYPYFRYIELFDIASGMGIKGYDNITRPYDCIFNSYQNAFWIADAGSGGLYRLPESGDGLELFNSSLKEPILIKQNAQNLFFILDSEQKSIWFFDRTGSLIKELSYLGDYALNDPKYIAASSLCDLIFVIDQQKEERVLVKYDYGLDQAEVIFRSTDLSLAAIDTAHQSLWLALNSADSSKILQLSFAGERLVEKAHFTRISDLLISPYTGHLVVADGWAGVLYHFRTDFSLVGASKKAYYPYKVYSQ